MKTCLKRKIILQTVKIQIYSGESRFIYALKERGQFIFLLVMQHTLDM